MGFRILKGCFFMTKKGRPRNTEEGKVRLLKIRAKDEELEQIYKTLPKSLRKRTEIILKKGIAAATWMAMLDVIGSLSVDEEPLLMSNGSRTFQCGSCGSEKIYRTQKLVDGKIAIMYECQDCSNWLLDTDTSIEMSVEELFKKEMINDLNKE